MTVWLMECNAAKMNTVCPQMRWCCNSIEMSHFRLDAAHKNTEMIAECEKSRKPTRARVILSSSDEDENEPNDQQVSTRNAVLGNCRLNYHVVAG